MKPRFCIVIFNESFVCKTSDGQHLAVCVAGVVYVDDADSELGIDLDHLADVFADAPRWGEAWDQYEARNPPPHDDAGYERWRQRGPRPDDFALGLFDCW